MKLLAKYFLLAIFLFLFLSFAAQAQTTSASVNITVKIPPMLEVEDYQVGSERHLRVRTNVKEFCVVFMDQQATRVPTQYNNQTRLKHCFNFMGRETLKFYGVDPSWSMMALQTP